MAAQGHILIVDDEAALRHTLARILQRAGMEVTTAGNGQEAIDYLGRQPFDLVYLDIRMPDMNGLKALKIIHDRQPDLPVVLFTAQPDLSSAMEAVREGAADYLLKPLSPKTIVERTRTILARGEKERRRREIEAQIGSLKAELRDLEEVRPAADNGAAAFAESGGRYLTRGQFTLDLHARRLLIGQKAVDLPPTAFDSLLVLARHAPNVVDYQTLVAEAQGYQTEPREAQEIVKWHVHHIRRAIEADVHRPCRLINVRGAGYRLVPD